MTASTVLLNACGSQIRCISWEHAISLVISGKAEIEEADPERTINSVHLSFPFPKIIRLVRYVYIKFTRKYIDGEIAATKKGILRRDKNTCGYCGSKANTVDHIIPTSKGGKLTWVNCISACQPCNLNKGSQTLEESGMKLLWTPQVPN